MTLPLTYCLGGLISWFGRHPQELAALALAVLAVLWLVFLAGYWLGRAQLRRDLRKPAPDRDRRIPVTTANRRARMHRRAEIQRLPPAYIDGRMQAVEDELGDTLTRQFDALADLDDEPSSR